MNISWSREERSKSNNCAEHIIFSQLLEWLSFLPDEKKRGEIMESHLGATWHGWKWIWVGSQGVLVVPARTLSSCGIFNKFLCHLAFNFNLSFVIFFSNSDFFYRPNTCYIFRFFPSCPTSNRGSSIGFNSNIYVKYACFSPSCLLSHSSSHDYLSPRLQKWCHRLPARVDYPHSF